MEKLLGEIIYCLSTSKVFCYMYKLFGYSAGSSNEFCNQFTSGFVDWKNVSVRIISDEKSKNRIAALSMMLQGKKSARIDADLQKENEKLCKYWTEVLKRVIAVIKFHAGKRISF